MKLKSIIESKFSHPTKKYIFINGNKTIECTFVDRETKYIICLSCMMGCRVGCKFCRSGRSYFGELNSEDIIYMATTIVISEKIWDKKILFSFMGSGEPLFNVMSIRSVIERLHLFPKAYFALSTSGVVIDNLPKLYFPPANCHPKIQLSLHSPYDKERNILIPNSPKIEDIFRFLSEYKEVTGKEIELNYILLDGINDSIQHAIDLSKIVKGSGFSLKINNYHDVELGYKESSKKEKFIKWIQEEGICPEVYSTDGHDIEASCGQLKSENVE